MIFEKTSNDLIIDCFAGGAVQDAVGSPKSLRDWAMMDSSAIESTVQANFYRAYRNVLKRRKREIQTATGITAASKLMIEEDS